MVSPCPRGTCHESFVCFLVLEGRTGNEASAERQGPRLRQGRCGAGPGGASVPSGARVSCSVTSISGVGASCPRPGRAGTGLAVAKQPPEGGAAAAGILARGSGSADRGGLRGQRAAVRWRPARGAGGRGQQEGQCGAHPAVGTLPAPAVQLAHGQRQPALQAALGPEPAPRVAAQDFQLSVDGLGGVGGGPGTRAAASGAGAGSRSTSRSGPRSAGRRARSPRRCTLPASRTGRCGTPACRVPVERVVRERHGPADLAGVPFPTEHSGEHPDQAVGRCGVGR